MMVPPGESDLKSQKPGRKGQTTEPEEENGHLNVEDEPEDMEETRGEESEERLATREVKNV
jgi:hypothetical protein